MDLLEVLSDEGVVGVDEVVGVAVEDDMAVVENEECGVGVGFAFGERLDAFAVVRIAVRGEHEGVLQAVRDQERGGVGGIALLDDEFDDGGGGDGIEATCG